MKRILCAVVLVFISSCVWANDLVDEATALAANNISDEYITCGVFYSIVAAGLVKSGNPESAANAENAANTAMELGLQFARNGRSNEMAAKVFKAKMELNYEEMTKSMGNDFGNISILLNKHSNRCKWGMNNPEELVKEWMNKSLETLTK